MTRFIKTLKLNKEEALLKVLILCPVYLDNDELKYCNSSELIFNGDISKKNQSLVECNCKGIPLPSTWYKSSPMVILVQSPIINPKLYGMSLKHIDFGLVESP